MLRTIFCLIALFVMSLTSVFGLSGRWPDKQGVYIAAAAKALPDFPKKISGFTALDNKDYFGEEAELSGRLRVDAGMDWVSIEDFPTASIDCIAGVYTFRWVAVDPTVKVASSVDLPDGTQERTGSFGYIYAPSCTQPSFKLATTPNGPESVEIKWEVRYWKTAG